MLAVATTCKALRHRADEMRRNQLPNFLHQQPIFTYQASCTAVHEPHVAVSCFQETLSRMPAPIAASLWPLNYPNAHLRMSIHLQPRSPKLPMHREQSLQVVVVMGILARVMPTLPRATPSTRSATPKNNLHSPASRDIHCRHKLIHSLM